VRLARILRRNTGIHRSSTAPIQSVMRVVLRVWLVVSGKEAGHVWHDGKSGYTGLKPSESPGALAPHSRLELIEHPAKDVRIASPLTTKKLSAGECHSSPASECLDWLLPHPGKRLLPSVNIYRKLQLL